MKIEKDILKHFKNDMNNSCYYISRFIDGEIIPFKEALKNLEKDSYSSIIILNNQAIIKEETEKGKPSIHLVRNA